jgi:hypothetical protein
LILSSTSKEARAFPIEEIDGACTIAKVGTARRLRCCGNATSKAASVRGWRLARKLR